MNPKLKPIATTTPAVNPKLRPIAGAAPTPAPEFTLPEQKGFLGTKKKDRLFDKVIDNSVTRGIQKFFPGAKVGEAIGTLAGLGITKAKEAAGIVPKGTTAQYDTSAPTPLQVAGDVAKGAATIAGFKLPTPVAPTAIKTIGKTALQAGGLGALSGAGQAAQDTQSTAVPTLKDAIAVAKGAVVGGATSAAIGGVTSGIAQFFKSAGTGIQNSVIKPLKADIDDGFKVETVQKYNLGGPLNVTAEKTTARMNELTRELNAKLASSDAVVDLDEAFEATKATLTSQKLKSFGSNTGVSRALEQLKAEIDMVGDVRKVPIPDAQIIKQAAGHNGAWQFGMTDPDASARQVVYNAFYSTMREAIEKNSPDGVREINKQLSELIPVMNAVIRRIPVADRNNQLGLTDIIALTAGSMDPAALSVFALTRAQRSGTVGNLFVKGSSKIQQTATPLATMLGGGAASLIPATQTPQGQ